MHTIMRGAHAGRTTSELLLEMVDWNRNGERAGLFSICSANRWVIESGMMQASADDTVVCIESTCNQVNQFGGYTGMNPADFRAFVAEVAAAMGFDPARVILGGDHLGPYAWRDEPAAAAMAKARELVRGCVLAGYTKIHLDASMRCADDPGAASAPLDEQLVTARAVELCAAAEAAHAELPGGAPAPVYVIGSEVPVPGGEQAGEHAVAVTRVADVEQTLSMAQHAFHEAGMQATWERVIALVVQPGVEFADSTVTAYDRRRARDLSACLKVHGPLVYEAHSTDYQSAAALRQLVTDHFAVLKVGPALTFAMREALFALEAIEREIFAGDAGATPSRLRDVLEAAMLEHPEHWHSYHAGSETERRLARAFSYSDRCRYYWPVPAVQDALDRLLRNLAERPIPETILSQYLPEQYRAVRRGELTNRPDALIRHAILGVIAGYAAACGMR
jgi:D-tagatose-1,6-bisphosphate aldolase subunit GatZ/KbaZ